MRKTPYTEIGIRRLECFKCGAKSTQQWNICADGDVYRPICDKCDIALNKLVLKFMGVKDWKNKIDAYKKHILQNK